jgi:hypothetical protein
MLYRRFTVRTAACAALVAGAALVSTVADSGVASAGFVASESCLTVNGSIKAFPGLTKTAQDVTEVISGTLSNCSFDGSGQIFSGSFFGTLSGTATKTSASLSGNVAVSWPADANLDPTISPISVSGSAKAYTFFGTIADGTGTGNELQGSYDVVSQQKITDGTSQSIVGAGPFGIYINEG